MSKAGYGTNELRTDSYLQDTHTVEIAFSKASCAKYTIIIFRIAEKVTMILNVFFTMYRTIKPIELLHMKLSEIEFLDAYLQFFNINRSVYFF